MSANPIPSQSKSPTTLEERLRLLREDVQLAAQSFDLWDRLNHHLGQDRSVAAVNQSSAQLWFQVSVWASLEATLMALGRLYDRTNATVTLERIANELLAQKPADPSLAAGWKALSAGDSETVNRLRKIRDKALAHRTGDRRIVFGNAGLLVQEVEDLVENAKRKLKLLERAAGVPSPPFYDREQVSQSVDPIFDALIEQQARRKDAWVRLPEHYTFIQRLRQHPAVTRLIVFGSWARGEQRPGSDIDLAIDAVGAQRSALDEIDAILDEPDTLRPIDAVWLDQLPADSSLWAAIRRDGKVLKGAMIE